MKKISNNAKKEADCLTGPYFTKVKSHMKYINQPKMLDGHSTYKTEQNLYVLIGSCLDLQAVPFRRVS